ncbi:hypothetical protein C8T65DRAFT_751346 [Cerioporus squamosus]|nr:hypothetical protein C8T65DRAFT_751346 [Cerioporus squamosus]
MSRRQDSPHDDCADDKTPRTPNGARVLVFATPTSQMATTQQQNAGGISDTQNDSGAQALGSPLVIDDTLDLQTPPALPPPRATQARRRSPLAERDTPPAPPATQPRRRTPLEVRDVNVPATTGARGQLREGRAGIIPAAQLREVQARAAQHAWTFSQTAATLSGASEEGSLTAVDETPGSTPLNFSWNTATGTPSPSVCAAETRARTDASARGAAVSEGCGSGTAAQTPAPGGRDAVANSVGPTAQAPEAIPSATTARFPPAAPTAPAADAASTTAATTNSAAYALPQSVTTTAPTATTAPAAGHPLTHGAGALQQNESGEDLFRFFATPPAFAETTTNGTQQGGQEPAAPTSTSNEGHASDTTGVHATLGGDAGPGERTPSLETHASGRNNARAAQRARAAKRTLRRL